MPSTMGKRITKSQSPGHFSTNCLRVKIRLCKAADTTASLETRMFDYAKTKAQISYAIIEQLISTFVFATQIVHSLFINSKISSFWPISETVQVGLCQTWTSFLDCVTAHFI